MHKRYFLIVLGLLLGFEACCRIERDTLFESTHRALFKLAMYRKHGRADVLFLGTSRTGEALRPNAFLSEAPADIQTAFNASVQYSSLDILSDVVDRIAASELKPRLAIVEVSHHQRVRAPVPWGGDVSEKPRNGRNGKDFEGMAADWLAEHSELMRLRKAFVLDSLARFVGVALFATRFDGSEQFGIDYVDSLLGRRRALSDEPRRALEHVVYDDDDAAAADPVAGHPETVDLALYPHIAAALNGTRLIFYVPPHQGTEPSTPEQQTFYRVLAAQTKAPVYDFSMAALPDDYFRDPTHMSHKGGLVFAREFAALLAEPHAVQ